MTRHLAFALYMACCLLALVWPGYALVAQAAPERVLGLPFALLWNVLWIVGTFVACGVYELTGRDRG